MGADPEDLAARFRATIPAVSPEHCPPADALWELARGEAPADRIEELVQHTMDCRDCAAGLGLARELWEAGRRPAAVETAPIRPRPRRWGMRAIPLAAAAAVAATILIWRGPGGRSPEAVFYERGSPTERRFLATGPKGPQPRDGVILRWSSYPGALRYRVTIADSSLHVFFERIVSGETELHIPPSTFEKQPLGARLVWRVEAFLPDGRTEGSEAFDLQLR